MRAPAATVSPDSETAHPSASPPTPSADATVAIADHVPAARPNMRMLPWFWFSPTSSDCAPAAMMSPDSETEEPSSSFAAPSAAVSVACATHERPLRVNTRTLPCALFEPMSSPGAPIASVSPTSDTDWPKLSFAAPSDADSVPCASHEPIAREYMRTVPWNAFEPTESFGTPTASMSPESDTDQPKLSNDAPSEAVSVAWVVHVVPERPNTRTLPWLPFDPTVSETTPIASNSPESDTDQPKLSPAAPSDAVSVCCAVQVLPLRVNTRTLP